MSYYIFIQNNKLNGAGECRQITEGVINFEVEEDLYNSFVKEPDKYTFDGKKIILNPDYEKEKEEKERERLDNLSLTAADVERAIYKAKGMDFEDIVNFVSKLQEDTSAACHPELVSGSDKINTNTLDLKALKIELKANNFYRGNPYINKIGTLLGFSEAQLDEFFETGDYTALLPAKEIKEEVSSAGKPLI